MADGEILLVSSVSFLGGLSSRWIVGSRLDALGSKPESVDVILYDINPADWATGGELWSEKKGG